jgi:predicted AAA+ superfamily ATPase
MQNIYFHREIEKLLAAALKHFPAVLVTGARQTGKSTLLKESLKTYRYANLDDPALRALAIQDPRLFLSTYRPPVIIDEIQYAPGLLSYIKLAIDERRHLSGQFALTGSQVFQLMQGVSETLAGRIAIFDLFPFGITELPQHLRSALKEDLAMAAQLIRGFYPELNVHQDLDRDRWFSSYIATYLERDVRNIKQIADLTKFQTFISLLASRAGGLLNLSEIAKEGGITQPTARAWLTILQSTYIVNLLQPWHRNISKRVVKTPKLYFTDTGLLCHLLGIDTAERFFKSGEKGRLFENMIVMETRKRLSVRSERTNLYFYRTAAGVEIDLLIERGEVFKACEIKLAKTPDRSLAANLIRFQADHGFAKGMLLTLQDFPLPIRDDITSLNWQTGLAEL